MDDDGLDDLMQLENVFFKEGYDDGVADGVHAGFIEGKLFGIEKGYEKALEMGKLRGRAMVWKERASKHAPERQESLADQQDEQDGNTAELRDVAINLEPFHDSTRLLKHIDALLKLVQNDTLDSSNSDEAVAEWEEQLMRAKNKAKVIGNITGETLSSGDESSHIVGIEDAKGLTARH